MEQFKYLGKVYRFNADLPDFCMYDNDDEVHLISYTVIDKFSQPYRAEWRIRPGVGLYRDSIRLDVLKMIHLIAPWDLIPLYNRHSRKASS